MALLSNTGIRAGASGVTAADDSHRIKRSARFNDDDSAYLVWTPTAAGNQKKWTWSAWVKRSSFGASGQVLMQLHPSGLGYTRLRFVSDKLAFDGQDASAGSGSDVKTNRLFRDPSAWYHICVAMDTTQATDTNRLKMYVNGVQETSFDSPTWPTQNVDYMFNYAHAHNIGRHDGDTEYFDGLMSDIHFIDGTAKAATDFGETNSTTGQWVPKEYDGTYGTNGFHLAMDPANGGTGWSRDLVSVSGLIEPANQNERAFDGDTSTYCRVNGSSKMVWTPSTPVAFTSEFGGWFGGDTASGQSSTFECVHAGGTLDFSSSVSSVHAYLSLSGLGVTSPITSISVESTNNNPRIAAITRNSKILVDHSAIGYDSSDNENHWHGNNIFGHEATVANDNFKAVTYTGTGSDQAIDIGFKPDLVWIKTTNEDENHFIADSVRGEDKPLYVNLTAAEETNANRLKSFDTTGFTVGTTDDTNQDDNTFVSWAWKAGGAASSNSDGAITSSVSANTDAGFSVVKWTGNRSNTTVGHGLGKALKLMIVKNLDSATANWIVFHDGLPGATTHMVLNLQNAAGTASTPWNNTDPTSSVFHLGADSETNGDGDEMIAYCWSEIPGHSSFGSYIGNSDGTNGPIVDCGFTPSFLMIKGDIAGEDWVITDTARNSSNPHTEWLFANDATDTISTNSYDTDITPNGFQIKNTNPRFNTSGKTYIYVAFAGSPEGDLDLLADTPGAPYDNELNGGGNYATFNSLAKINGGSAAFRNGNLNISGGSTNGASISTINPTSGKYYFELDIQMAAGQSQGNMGVGIVNELNYTVGNPSANDYPSTFCGFFTRTEINSVVNGSESGAQTTEPTVSYTWGLKVDYDATNMTLYLNGVEGNTVSFASNSNPLLYFLWGNTANTMSVNFGQRVFKYAVPTDYKALNTYNLPNPTITKGSNGFDVLTWTGDNSSPRTLTGLNFDPDMIWLKCRSNSVHHNLYDDIRGWGAGKELVPNDNHNEGKTGGGTGQTATYGWIDDTTSSGFIVKEGSADATNTNSNSLTYAAWCWDAGSSNVVNDASSTGVGSVDSTYRVNTNTGFSIVSWVGTGSVATVAHGCNAVPEFMIVKNRDDDDTNWCVYHSGLTSATYALALDTNYLQDSNGPTWNSTAPTSSVFTVGTRGSANESGSEMIGYIFAPVAGYSKFGSWIGPDTEDHFIYCGFKPRFLICKQINANGEWVIYDTERDPGNQDAVNNTLVANEPDEEAGHFNANQTSVDLLSNGFKIRHTGAPLGDNGATYVFAAFAESPFKYANAR